MKFDGMKLPVKMNMYKDVRGIRKTKYGFRAYKYNEFRGYRWGYKEVVCSRNPKENTLSRLIYLHGPLSVFNKHLLLELAQGKSIIERLKDKGIHKGGSFGGVMKIPFEKKEKKRRSK